MRSGLAVGLLLAAGAVALALWGPGGGADASDPPVSVGDAASPPTDGPPTLVGEAIDPAAGAAAAEAEAVPPAARPAGARALQPFGAEDGAGEAPPKGDCPVRTAAGWLDLSPTLRRLEREGAQAAGELFANAEKLLPVRPDGHYSLHAVDGGSGEDRLVVGAHGEVFFSADAGESFSRVHWRRDAGR